HLAYAPLVRHYRKRLGDDRVLVTTYEDFRCDPQPTLDALCEFVGVDGLAPAGDERSLVNRGLSDRSVSVMRRVNALSRFERMPEEPLVNLRLRSPAARILRKLDRADTAWSRPTEVEARVRELVGDRYATDNADLAALLGVDLGALGWRT
ncbi:MAG: hypothetical protein ACJ739_07360, partial [Acidimicrobiales bacterium]